MITKRRFTIVTLILILCLMVGCAGQEVAPSELTNQLDYHDGYWVATMDVPDRPVAIKIINDMHIDAATNSVTVYAQSKALGRIISPPQLNPDECTKNRIGQTACFHPNAVYLNGSGEELMKADGTGEWWVKQTWVLGGEGYDNCELKPLENYYDCFWAEGVLLDDGMSMQVGAVEESLNGFYNIRTPLLDEQPITYQVTRFEPKNDDPTAGDIDLTPTEQLVLTFECEEEVSAFDNRARECPHQKN